MQFSMRSLVNLVPLVLNSDKICSFSWTLLRRCLASSLSVLRTTMAIQLHRCWWIPHKYFRVDLKRKPSAYIQMGVYPSGIKPVILGLEMTERLVHRHLCTTTLKKSKVIQSNLHHLSAMLASFHSYLPHIISWSACFALFDAQRHRLSDISVNIFLWWIPRLNSLVFGWEHLQLYLVCSNYNPALIDT